MQSQSSLLLQDKQKQQQEDCSDHSQPNSHSRRRGKAQLKSKQVGVHGHPNQPSKSRCTHRQGGHTDLPSSPIAQLAPDGASIAGEKGPAVYDTTRLTNAAKPEQKQILGEWLFPKIRELEPQQAGKITGMLLEFENAEILHLLEDQGALVVKVEEAVEVLKAHQQYYF